MDKRDTIVEAAARTLSTRGMAEFTVARVAAAARVSSALVHYHFATKRKLLAAAAERLAARRTAGRVAPLREERGVAALDRLWAGLSAGVEGGAERAWHDLGLVARENLDVAATMRAERRAERAAIAGALPALSASLGAQPGIPADDLAAVVSTYLDGVALSLAERAPRHEVRAAFDAFWLALVSLGSAARGR
jgi:AcrR family transcriptional regulator